MGSAALFSFSATSSSTYTCMHIFQCRRSATSNLASHLWCSAEDYVMHWTKSAHGEKQMEIYWNENRIRWRNHSRHTDALCRLSLTSQVLIERFRRRITINTNSLKWRMTQLVRRWFRKIQMNYVEQMNARSTFYLLEVMLNIVEVKMYSHQICRQSVLIIPYIIVFISFYQEQFLSINYVRKIVCIFIYIVIITIIMAQQFKLLFSNGKSQK